MKRMTRLTVATVAAVLVLTLAQAPAQDSTPPGPGDEWQQEDWTTTPQRRNRPMRSGGSMSMQGPMFGPDEFQQQMQQMQNRFFGMQSQFQDMQRLAAESRDAALRQSLGVNDQEWMWIKPKLDRIEQLKAGAYASIEPGSFIGGATFGDGFGTGGGWSGGFTTGGSSGPGQNWSRTETFGPGGARSTRTNAGEPTQAELLCQELHNLLRTPGVPPAQISQKVAALRQAKQRTQTQLQRERTQLRAMVNLQQEAALIVMGYLD